MFVFEFHLYELHVSDSNKSVTINCDKRVQLVTEKTKTFNRKNTIVSRKRRYVLELSDGKQPYNERQFDNNNIISISGPSWNNLNDFFEKGFDSVTRANGFSCGQSNKSVRA